MARTMATVDVVEKMINVNFPLSFIDMEREQPDFVLLDPDDVEVLKLSSEDVVSIMVYDRNHPFRTKIAYVDPKLHTMVTDEGMIYLLQPATKK
jgi:hypothetical protein